MTSRLSRLAALAFVAALAGCAAERSTGPDLSSSPRFDSHTPLVGPAIVISQVYGGGGNSGATLRNDFIELFNRSHEPVDVTGWSVQYASAAGSSWNVTALSGTIAPGGYYLVQQAAGSGGSADLPTPDATGTAAMSASAGKVVLVRRATAVTGACATDDPDVVDRVGFGSNSTAGGCETEWGLRTANLSNTTAAVRLANGCSWSGVAATDFSVDAPTPRNSASPTVTCGTTVTPEVARVSVTPAAATVTVGGTVALTATAFDADDAAIGGTSFTWSTSTPTVATVSTTGIVAGIAPGTATIIATTSNGTAGSATITVEAAPPPSDAPVVISQVYGGGGNSGAPFANDFVELFNAGSEPVSLDGWAVQYASPAGTSYAATPLSGTIQPGRYYLVQQAAGAGAGAALPTPDATGSLSMGANAGKVLLTNTTTAITVACPVGGAVVDRVAYGSSSGDNACITVWGARTASTSNTTAALRRNDGCVDTGVNGDDFVVLAPAPRNSASPVKNCVEPPREQSGVTLLINELMGDPVNAESASFGEWFEVYNFGSAPVDLEGFSIVSGGTSQPPHVINRSVVVPAFGYAVLGRGADVLRNGGLTVDYNYFVGTATTIWLDDRDYLMLLDGAGARIDSVAWTSLPRGVTRALSPGSPRSPDADAEPWKFSTSTFGDGDYGTPGALNTPLANDPPFVSPNRVNVSGRAFGDAPLPVGFETQLFATLVDPSGTAVPTTFTWQSLTPAIASVDARGVIRALSAGLARFRVTAEDGATRVYSLPFEEPVASTVTYRDPLAVGTPLDADPADDFLLTRREFSSSWNGARGIPNWVAYQLDATHIEIGRAHV